MREMADRLDKVDCDNIVEAYEAAAMLRSIAAEREAEAKRLCGIDDVLNAKP